MGVTFRDPVGVYLTAQVATDPPALSKPGAPTEKGIEVVGKTGFATVSIFLHNSQSRRPADAAADFVHTSTLHRGLLGLHFEPGE